MAVEGKNVLSLVAVLTIGFGAGLFVGAMLTRRGTASQVDVAVERAVAECESRHREAAPVPAETTVSIEVPGTAGAAPGTVPGVSGGSGTDMINRLLRQKPLPGSPEGETGQPPQQITPVPPEAPRQASARVYDTKIASAPSGVVVTGTAKNDTEVRCVSAEVTIVGHDRRGATTGQKTGTTMPLDIDAFGTSTFRIEFPPGTDVATVTGTVACH